MKDEYDFSNSIPNPYKRIQKTKITMQVDQEALDYFKSESERNGVPYQTIINFYLLDCARSNKHLSFA